MSSAHLGLLLSFSLFALRGAAPLASAAETAGAAPEAAKPSTSTPAPKVAAGSSGDASAPIVSEQHIAAGLECANCHGPAEKKVPVESEKCLECHTSFAEVAKRTARLKPNPHANHFVDSGVAECVGCHHGHSPRTLVCTDCHTVRFEKTSAPGR